MSTTDATGWRPIETIPSTQGSFEIKFRNGKTATGPAPVEATRAQKLTLARRGGWPDAGWTPTHWRPAPPGDKQ